MEFVPPMNLTQAAIKLYIYEWRGYIQEDNSKLTVSFFFTAGSPPGSIGKRNLIYLYQMQSTSLMLPLFRQGFLKLWVEFEKGKFSGACYLTLWLCYNYQWLSRFLVNFYSCFKANTGCLSFQKAMQSNEKKMSFLY